MKKKLIKAGIIVIIIFLMVLFFSLWIKQRKETKRHKENFEIELLAEKNRQQEITKKQLKDLFPEQVEILKEQGIKPKQVEKIIEVEYNYIDSVIPRYILVPVYDTVRSDTTKPFDVESSCNRIKGVIIKDTLQIESIQTTDSLLISLYKEKRKCLFEKRKIKAIAVSKCKGDTMQVIRNLTIIK